MIDDNTAVLSGLDGRKMSKSYDNTIPLFADEKQLKKLIMKIKTNSLEPGEPKETEGSTLFEIYDAQLPVVVADAYAQGIPTYVVGIDIEDVVSPMMKDGNPDSTNTFEKLNEVAEAGGQARPGAEKFYNTANQVELQAALMSISELITSCTFELNGVVDLADICEGTVEVDGMPLECPADWQMPDDQHIELIGDACEALRDGQPHTVSADFPCGSVFIP